ncbi:glycosyltransferase family 4 protein [Exiguobacterium sp. s150]|uniref:glycosyltransferase family 4 protein n=1 Tax=Exiguobacterium sp. s150 TaxID=2751221 RepID=UPI001BE7F82E|nr:glycosyltransferase family 4 protein [Exiguobacterium sp. s150]
MKKKIVYIINHFRPGAIPNILKDIAPHISNEFDVKVLSLQKFNKEPSLFDEFEKIGVEVQSLNVNKCQLISTFHKLRQFIREQKPDIIHSHLGRADFFSAICKNRSSRLITTFHSMQSNYNHITKLSYYFTNRLADHRTSVSDAVRDSWKSNSSNCDNITIYNPVSINDYSEKIINNGLKESLGISKQDSIIINVGNLKKQKGQIYLVRAFYEVLKTKPNTSLVIVGRSGDAEKELLSEVKKLDIENKVHLIGFRKDISQLLNLSDVFVFPSKSEGLGISVLEAMASKTPVVASDLPSISEYISENETGFLVKYDDINEMSSKIIRILEDESLKDFIVNKAFDKVQKEFNPIVIANNYLSLYNKVLKQTKSEIN